MTIVEKDEEAATAVTAVVVTDPEKEGLEYTTVSTAGSVCGAGTCALVSGSGRDCSMISVDPTIFKLATVGEVEDLNKRKATLFCACCCDILRACIIVNIIFICLNVLGLLLSVWGITMLDAIDLTKVDDDDFVENFEAEKERSSTVLFILILEQGIGILFAIVGIIGASKFMMSLVLAAAVWYCIDLCISAYFENIAGCIIRFFFAYPHIALFSAFWKNHITRETYVDRERSCCCNDKN